MESITPSVRLQSLVVLCLACGFTNKCTSMKISTDVEADWGSKFGQQLWWYMGAKSQEETSRQPMCLYQLYTQVKPLETSRHHCVYVYCTLNRRKASTPCVRVNCTLKLSPRRQANIPWICVNCAVKEHLMQNTLILHPRCAHVFHASFYTTAQLQRLQGQVIFQGPVVLFFVEWHLETNTKDILAMLQ